MVGGGSAAALGIGYGGVGGNSKLSRERKFRMRELATQKLSLAYHLDEIAASVATMQSASTLEDVASFVLNRNGGPTTGREEGLSDAKYVHFFHEKIPSRMMAQYTTLDVLDSIIAERPHDASPWRTRALTRIFKEDYLGAARDLSEALAIARVQKAQHRAGRDQLVLAQDTQEKDGRDFRYDSNAKVAEEDQPSSMESQLLFHRAGVYLTIAVQHVDQALQGLQEAEEAGARREAQRAAGEEPEPESEQETEAYRTRYEARKQVRMNAKRALRDYTAFLSFFEYTPGLAPEVTEALLRQLEETAQAGSASNKTPTRQLLDSASLPAPPVSDALVPAQRRATGAGGANPSLTNFPPPPIFKISQLFEPLPPAGLPPFPSPAGAPSTSASDALPFPSTESLSYHPLLSDALHSLLLAHALVQTPPKELLRHAHNTARLVRLCDGYPVFLSSRSPSRADWGEVLRRVDKGGKEWLGRILGGRAGWEALCTGQEPKSTAKSAKNAGAGKSEESDTALAVRGKGEQAPQKTETELQKRDRLKQAAILDALADERVVDEASFQQAVRAREERFAEDEEVAANTPPGLTLSGPGDAGSTPAAASSSSSSEDQAQSNGTPAATATQTAKVRPKSQGHVREFLISTERAEAVARWVREAPAVSEGGSGAKKGRRRKKVPVRSAGAGAGSPE